MPAQTQTQPYASSSSSRVASSSQPHASSTHAHHPSSSRVASSSTHAHRPSSQTQPQTTHSLVTNLNALLHSLSLPLTLLSPTDLTPSLLIAVLESILGRRIPLVERFTSSSSSGSSASVNTNAKGNAKGNGHTQTQTQKDKTAARVQNMKIFLGTLQLDVLPALFSELDSDAEPHTEEETLIALTQGLSTLDPRLLADGAWDEVVFVGEVLVWVGVRLGLIRLSGRGGFEEGDGGQEGKEEKTGKEKTQRLRGGPSSPRSYEMQPGGIGAGAGSSSASTSIRTNTNTRIRQDQRPKQQLSTSTPSQTSAPESKPKSNFTPRSHSTSTSRSHYTYGTDSAPTSRTGLNHQHQQQQQHKSQLDIDHESIFLASSPSHFGSASGPQPHSQLRPASQRQSSSASASGSTSTPTLTRSETTPPSSSAHLRTPTTGYRPRELYEVGDKYERRYEGEDRHSEDDYPEDDYPEDDYQEEEYLDEEEDDRSLLSALPPFSSQDIKLPNLHQPQPQPRTSSAEQRHQKPPLDLHQERHPSAFHHQQQEQDRRPSALHHHQQEQPSFLQQHHQQEQDRHPSASHRPQHPQQDHPQYHPHHHYPLHQQPDSEPQSDPQSESDPETDPDAPGCIHEVPSPSILFSRDGFEFEFPNPPSSAPNPPSDPNSRSHVPPRFDLNGKDKANPRARARLIGGRVHIGRHDYASDDRRRETDVDTNSSFCSECDPDLAQRLPIEHDHPYPLPPTSTSGSSSGSQAGSRTGHYSYPNGNANGHAGTSSGSRFVGGGSGGRGGLSSVDYNHSNHSVHSSADDAPHRRVPYRYDGYIQPVDEDEELASFESNRSGFGSGSILAGLYQSTSSSNSGSTPNSGSPSAFAFASPSTPSSKSTNRHPSSTHTTGKSRLGLGSTDKQLKLEAVKEQFARTQELLQQRAELLGQLAELKLKGRARRAGESFVSGGGGGGGGDSNSTAGPSMGSFG